VPSSADEFLKIWKKQLKTIAERYSFLLAVGSKRLGQIFQNEISFGLLGEMLNVLNSSYSEEDCSQLVALLQALSMANRFSLSVQFLDKSERAACSQLLKQLRETSVINRTNETSQETVDVVNGLMSVYGV